MSILNAAPSLVPATFTLPAAATVPLPNSPKVSARTASSRRPRLSMKEPLSEKQTAYPIPRVTFPVVHVDGEPYDQGLQHGVALRAQIAHNLDVYYDRFLREGQLQPEEARARAATYEPVLAGGAYYQALAGMAKGSGQELIDLV